MREIGPCKGGKRDDDGLLSAWMEEWKDRRLEPVVMSGLTKTVLFAPKAPSRARS